MSAAIFDWSWVILVDSDSCLLLSVFLSSAPSPFSALNLTLSTPCFTLIPRVFNVSWLTAPSPYCALNLAPNTMFHINTMNVCGALKLLRPDLLSPPCNLAPSTPSFHFNIRSVSSALQLLRLDLLSPPCNLAPSIMLHIDSMNTISASIIYWKQSLNFWKQSKHSR